MEQTISDRERLIRHLEKCIAAEHAVLLAPELTRIALKALREYSPPGKRASRPPIASRTLE